MRRTERRRWVLLAIGAVLVVAAGLAFAKRDWLRTFRQEGRCRKGSQEECIELAMRLNFGDGVGPDRQRALQLWAVGITALEGKCLAGDLDACLRGASLSRDNEHDFPQPGFAAKLGAHACELGSEKACLDEAMRLESGPTPDAARALALRVKACDHGDCDTCLDIGELYRYQHIPSPVEVDPSKAVLYFGKACDRGSGDGCMRSGQMLQRGEGVAVDVARAAELYRRGIPLLDAQCKSVPTLTLGYAQAGACHLLGSALDTGRGTARDLQRAVDVWKIGCAVDEPLSCVALGVPASKLKGISIDTFYHGTVPSLVKSCGEGRASDCVRAAQAYADGRAVAENASEADRLRTRAIELYRAECEHDEPLGCAALGDQLKREIAGKRDTEGAIKAYSRASFLLNKKCDSGGWSECEQLARMYLDGRVAGQDLPRGWELYNRVVDHYVRDCDSGRDSDTRRAGCNSLATLSDMSDVRPRNPARALEYYRRCCILETKSDGSCCKSVARLEGEAR
jgi:TPR repeat protein